MVTIFKQKVETISKLNLTFHRVWDNKQTNNILTKLVKHFFLVLFLTYKVTRVGYTKTANFYNYKFELGNFLMRK